MHDTATTSITVIVIVAVWLGWSLLSETRHNHGFWVAVLLPLWLCLLPVLWVIFMVITFLSFAMFVLIGRKSEHPEFMRQLRVRSGVFLLW